jgi:hypothetical protein
MGTFRIGSALGSGRWRALRAGAVALAAVGVVGAVPPVVASASAQSAPNWTDQTPAAHPSARIDMAMAYDAAAGNVVLFGGTYDGNNDLGDTWTWNGTTWTQQHPAASPNARDSSAMAYDAATGTVVLFGGTRPSQTGGAPQIYGDTWTWNGTTWTQQHPATSPPARYGATMAYDAATGDVVLFGGNGNANLDDTWTWNGTTWTQQHPATSPPTRLVASMAYDAATGDVVLFGGDSPTTETGRLDDTWTWNGTNWTEQAPATHPSARFGAAMTYDAATGNVVLFGGAGPAGKAPGTDCVFGDTWTWNGTTWTKQDPTTSPRARSNAAMAYDAAEGAAVMFGGYDETSCSAEQSLAQTWTWG